MSTQTGLSAFAEESGNADEHDLGDWPAVDSWGPTSTHPVPEWVFNRALGIEGTALAPSDFELVNGYYVSPEQDFHPDDQHRPDRRNIELEDGGFRQALNDQPTETSDSNEETMKSNESDTETGPEGSEKDISERFDGDERGRIKHHAEKGNMSSLLRVLGATNRMNQVELFADAGIESPADLVTHYEQNGDFEAIDAIGPKTSETIEAAIPLIRESIEIDPEPEPIATDGGVPVADLDDLPENETVRMIAGITRVQHSPSVIEGETSGSGKTISVEHNGRSHRLDTETILSGDSEFRNGRYYEIYTPGRLRKTQRTNQAYGPEAGANGVSDISDLPDPTHWPTTDQPDDAPDQCPKCHEENARWIDEGRPRCERCGELVPEKEEEKSEKRKEYERNKDRIDEIDRGDVILLDSMAGEYLVTKKRRDVAGTLRGFDLVDQEGIEYRLNTFLHDGVLFDIERKDGNRSIMKNVANIDDIQDFDIVRKSDEDWLKSWIRSSYYGDDDEDSDHRVMTDGGRDLPQNIWLILDLNHKEGKRRFEDYGNRIEGIPLIEQKHLANDVGPHRCEDCQEVRSDCYILRDAIAGVPVCYDCLESLESLDWVDRIVENRENLNRDTIHARRVAEQLRMADKS